MAHSIKESHLIDEIISSLGVLGYGEVLGSNDLGLLNKGYP